MAHGRTRLAASVARTALALLAVVLVPRCACAGIEIDPAAEPAFRSGALQALGALATSTEPAIRHLHAAATNAPATITLRPITADRATWHPDGDRTRGHTQPGDGLPRSNGRDRPTDAVVHLPPDTFVPGSARWKGGLLVHELVHAIDLAYGRYHPAVSIRERRAVFLQNVWRASQGVALRTSYHGRFATTDLQQATKRGDAEEVARHVFTRPDLPMEPQERLPANR